jgi:hypothetical protein
MTVLIFAADDQADIFALFQHVVALEDEALLVCLDETRPPGMQRTSPS